MERKSREDDFNLESDSEEQDDERDEDYIPPASTNRSGQYRASRTGGRSVRDQIDHDVFSGLPVRHWRKQPVQVNPAPPKDPSTVADAQDNGWPELPMPKDSHLLPPWSQALLRAARMGQIYRPRAAPVEEDREAGEDEDVEGDIEPGFVATRWGVVPRHLEGPEPEFLAKRRKGLRSLYSGAVGATVGSEQMRKTKIRKTDADGTDHILEALVPIGQAVEGEIVENETTISEVPAPGTVVDGVGIVNAEGVVVAGDQAQPTPPRRRPPPPKRKAKGPGRGRKKRVEFAPGAEGSADLQGVNRNVDGGDAASGEHGQATQNDEIEMGEDSMLQDGEEGSDEEDEGEEGEDGEREDGELSASPAPMEPPIKESRVTEVTNPEVQGPLAVKVSEPPVTSNAPPSNSPDLPVAVSQTGESSGVPVESSHSHLETIKPCNDSLSNKGEIPHEQDKPPSITVEPAQEAPYSLAPEMEEIPAMDRVSVEDSTYPAEEATEAAIPTEHDPLDGLTEPTTLEENTIEETTHVPAGEEDLLGSLERHLDKQGQSDQ